MAVKDWERKLRKYEKPTPFDKSLTPNHKWRLEQKLFYAEIVLQELNLPKEAIKDQIRYLIDEIPFKKLAPRCTNETIITALCLYIKFSYTKKRPLKDFKIANRNGLTEDIYARIVTQIAIHFQSKQPIYKNSSCTVHY
jgi:hypothetical protein